MPLLLVTLSTQSFLPEMGFFWLSRVGVVFISLLFCFPIQLVRCQFIASTSVVNGQAEWYGTPISTNPAGVPTLVSRYLDFETSYSVSAFLLFLFGAISAHFPSHHLFFRRYTTPKCPYFSYHRSTYLCRFVDYTIP